MAVSLRERMRLSKELAGLRKTVADTSGNQFTRMKAARRLLEVRKLMGFKTSAEPASNQVEKIDLVDEKPEQTGLNTVDLNKLEPRPFIEKLESLMGGAVATVSEAAEVIAGYLENRGFA